MLHEYANLAIRASESDSWTAFVRRQAKVMPFPYATHRHPDFWPDAERFDPARWTPEAEATRHPYAFHPFAAGKRICLGNNFSLLETHVIAAMLVPRFQLRLKPGHQPRIVMEGTIAVKNGMPMRIEPREL